LIGNALGTASLAEQATQVLGSVVAGLLVFLASAVALRIEELELLKGFVARRVRR
jgi:hypothetical protein